MKRVILIVAMGFVMFGCAATAKDKPPLTVVDSVDLGRYLGKWYEIASYPAWFQKGYDPARLRKTDQAGD